MTEPLDLDSLFRLDGRVAIVTGASSGLGRRFARVLHQSGAQVVAAARREDRLADLASTLPGLVAARCDVSVEAERTALTSSVLEQFGHIDVLVNNAGVSEVTAVLDESLDSFTRVLEVNLIAAWRLAQLVGQAMIGGDGGVIVNVASIMGLVASGQVPQSGYVASKSGLVGITRELGAQWARKGVRVNAIAPGWFPSELTAEMTSDNSKGLAWIRGRTPMGRPGDETELDGPLLFLASDASSYLTGHTIAVDGGWTVV